MIVGFIGQQTPLVASIISINARWLLLFVLTSYIFFSGNLLRGLNFWLKAVLILYLSWCVLTLFWSDIPTLSCLKSVAMVFVSVILASSGLLWVNYFSWQKSLNWLFFLLAITLFIGLLGRGHESSINQLNEFDAYQGLTNNTNYFGSLQAMILPLLLWQIYINWHQRKKKFFWGTLLVLAIFFLIQSYSRASMLIAVCITVFFILSIDLKRKVVVGSLLVFFIVMILSGFSLSMNHLIYKNHDNDLLKTRRDVWSDSYSQAILGGWTGGGFGVTIGETRFGFTNLGSVGYGREKSNSQLAIVEETGLIGFGLYCLLLVVLLKKTIGCYLKLRGHEKVMMGLVLGALIGLLVQSFFEAWWDAPGSPEAIYFWTLFGIAAGLMRSLNRNRGSVSVNINLESAT